MADVPGVRERIVVSDVDDLRDVVHRAVACLAQGGLLALPTRGGYCWAASGVDASAVGRLRLLKGMDAGRALPVLLRTPEELSDWVDAPSLVAERLARRSWPGPLTLVVPEGAATGMARQLPEGVAGGDCLALRCPCEPLLRSVLPFCAGPLVLSSARTAAGELSTALDDVPGLDQVDMAIDEGVLDAPVDATVVGLWDAGWKTLREAALTQDELAWRVGTVLLFVCTGNTCRSPMAEAICRTLLAERLGCEGAEVARRGAMVMSAGVAAVEGQPAATHAAEVVRLRGGSLTGHRSRQLDSKLLRMADQIVAMTADHADALLDEFPEAEGRVRLLHAQGMDIADPIGRDRATYRQTAQEIEEHIKVLLDELGFQAGAVRA